MARTDPTLGCMTDARRDQSHLRLTPHAGRASAILGASAWGLITPIPRAGRLRAPSAERSFPAAMTPHLAPVQIWPCAKVHHPCPAHALPALLLQQPPAARSASQPCGSCGLCVKTSVCRVRRFELREAPGSAWLPPHGLADLGSGGYCVICSSTYSAPSCAGFRGLAHRGSGRARQELSFPPPART
jgi:hypothetical protein